MSSTRSTRIVAIAAIGLFATGGAILLRRSSESPTPRSDHASPPDDAPAAPRPSAPAVRSVDELAPQIPTPTATTAPRSFEALVAAGLATIRPSTPGGLEVHVVDRGSLAPVGGALVAALDIRLVLRRNVSRRAILEELPRIAHDLVLVRADHRGVAFVPRVMRQALLYAQHDEKFGGTGTLVGASRPVTIEIGPTLSFAVSVVDPTGTPLPGVAVEFERVRRSTQPPDGIARFEHVELWSEVQAGHLEKERWVSVDAPLFDPPGAAVDLGHLRPDPIRLVVPYSGRINLKLVERTGVACARRAVAGLRRTDPPHASDPPHEFLFDDGGVATLPCVELGARFTLTVKPRECDETTLEIEGPREAGQLVAVDVPVGATHVVLTGRVVDAAGKPVEVLEVAGRYETNTSAGESIVRSLGARVDDDGKFRIDWNLEREAGDAPPKTIHWETDVGDGRESRRLPFPTLPAAGDVDLGTIVLSPAPVVARGIVVDDAGNPLPRAVVVARPSSRLPTDSAKVITHCDAAGRFELRSSEATDGFEAHAISADLDLSPSAPLTGVDHELRLVVSRAGRVRGRIRAGHGFELPLRLTLVDANRKEIDGVDLQPDASGSPFEFRKVPPGRYDFEVAVGGFASSGERLLRVPDVVVNPASDTDDPRLSDVDPWQDAHFLEISVVNADGTPARDVEVTAIEPGHWPGDWVVSGRSGSVRIPTKRDRLTVAARARGARPRVVSDVGEGTTIRLDPMIIAHVDVAPLPASAPAGALAGLQFDWIGTAKPPLPRKWRQFWRSLDARQEADIGVPLAGEYRVRIYVDPGSHGLLSIDALPVTIRDTDEPQTIRIIAAPQEEKR